MSSSDEDMVRRPGRIAGASGRQTSADNDHNDLPPQNDSPNEMNMDNANEQEDDDADLFGSDGPDGELDNTEYGNISFAA